MLAASVVLALGGAGYSAYRWYTSPPIPPAPPLPSSIPSRRIETVIDQSRVKSGDIRKEDMLNELKARLAERKRREYEVVTNKDLE